MRSRMSANDPKRTFRRRCINAIKPSELAHVEIAWSSRARGGRNEYGGWTGRCNFTGTNVEPGLLELSSPIWAGITIACDGNKVYTFSQPVVPANDAAYLMHSL